MLDIKNLTVSIEGNTILKDFNLTVKDGEVAAIMGPNGTGKSTLAYVIAGKSDYEVESGEILLDGANILEMEPEERAAAGVFLAFQYPVEIPGVGTMTFFRAALNAQRKARGEEELTTPAFMKVVNDASAMLEIRKDIMKRALNVGFSGGEKKRMEVLQLALQQPRMAILDETDSGLDVDALKVVAEGVNSVARDTGGQMGVLIITHYQRILHLVQPTHVSILYHGRIVKQGGPDLVGQIESSGYGPIIESLPPEPEPVAS